MLCTMKIKLVSNDKQHKQLLDTMKQFNRACNEISRIAFDNKTFSKVKIQKLCYYDIREQFGLSSQMVVRAIGKVSESYKVNKQTLHTFKETGAIVYDQRILSFKGLEVASILTIEGRIEVSMIISKYHQGIMQGNRVRGQADLVLVDGTFYLLLVVDLPEKPLIESDGVLGVDLGVKNIASDSMGGTFSGSQLNGIRHRYFRLRQKLQKKGTKSTNRLLKNRRRKEKRFATNVNHTIAKRIVEKAERHRTAIALEDLSGIRKRTTVKKAQRRQHHSWAFYQLRQFIQYKAQKAGIPVFLVDPKNTSLTCPRCGYVDKKNRKSRDWFHCQSCDFSGPADNIAAINISRRAAV